MSEMLCRYYVVLKQTSDPKKEEQEVTLELIDRLSSTVVHSAKTTTSCNEHKGTVMHSRYHRAKSKL
jgi:hypothetical protein